ncbi:MAG: hypothetical protein JO286_03155 [Solirubrobacterales bacterium]|nr:hypothetical protein [Solirubrobacterales bacterium]
MSQALTPPLIVAALVLCAAGALKLRSPHGATGALRALGLPVRPWMVAALAAGELVLGVTCAVDPTRATIAILAGTYATFAGVATALAGGGAACGCFGEDSDNGEDETPASALHWMASAALGAVALVAALVGSHGLSWVLGRPAAQAIALVIGIGGALYAVVLAYTVVPRAWTSWSGE